MRHLPSASQVERAMACPGSERLPQYGSSSAAAQSGHVLHAYLEQAAKIGAEAALESVPPEFRDRCQSLPLENLPVGREWAQEVKLGWSVLTGVGHELGRGSDRDYRSAAADEFVGTADIIGIAGETVVVVDAKTGNQWLPPARESWQLKLLALAACRAYGKPRARIALMFLRDGAEEPGWSWHDLDEMDLDLIAADLRALAGRIKDPEAPIVEGAHCRYCPAIASCPPKLRLLHAVCTAPEAELPREITADNAAAVYRRYQQVKAVMGRVGEQLYEFAFSHPIDIGSGRVYGVVERQKEELDAHAVMAVISKTHGAEVAAKAIEISTSKAAIERALKPIAPPRGFAKMNREVLDEVRGIGGLIIKRTKEVREHSTEDKDAR